MVISCGRVIVTKRHTNQSPNPVCQFIIAVHYLELVWHFSNQGSLRKEFFVSLKKVVDANASVSGATDTAMAISVNHPQDLMLGCVYIYGR